MDITYVTERIIVLTFPDIGTNTTYRNNLKDVMQMLRTKHKNKYSLFNLSEKRHDLSKLNPNIYEFGWPAKLAPPLEKLCSICKAIDSWLTWDNQHVAVIHSKGDVGRIGVVVAAFMHYIDISSTADQALDRFTMKRFHDDKLAPFMNASQKRYVHYFAGLLTGAIKLNNSPVFLHNIIVYDAPSLDHRAGGRPFLKIYQGMQPIRTTSICSVSNKKSRRLIIVLKPSIQLRGDILIKCYQKKSSSSGRSTIFGLQFHTCILESNRLMFRKDDLDEVRSDSRFTDDGFIEFVFGPSANSHWQPNGWAGDEIVATSDESHDPVVRWDSFENFDLVPEDRPDPQLDAFAAQLLNPGHTQGPIDGSLYATVSKSASKKSPSAQHPLPNGDSASVDGPHTISIDSGISTLSAHQTSQGVVKPHLNGTLSGFPLNVEVEVHHHQSAHARRRPTPEEQAQLDELLSGMLQQAESLPDYPILKSHSTSAIKTSSLSSPPGKIPSISSTSDTMSTKKYSEYSSPRSIILNGSGATKTPSEIASPRYLTRPIFYSGSDDRTKPYHAQRGSQPFTYGVTSTSPAIQRRRIYSEATEHVKENIVTPVSPPPIEREISRETDEVFSDYTSSYQETFSDDGMSNLTWLQRQQLKLKNKKEGRGLKERHWKESRVIEELKTVTKKQPPMDESSRESSPPYSKPLHINTTTAMVHEPILPDLPTRSSSRNVDFAMYPAHATVHDVKRQVQRQKSDTSFDRQRPLVSGPAAYQQAKNEMSKFGTLPQQVATTTTLYGTVHPYHHVYMPHPRLDNDEKRGLLIESKGVDEVDLAPLSLSSLNSSIDRPSTPGFPISPRSTNQFQTTSPTLIRKATQSPTVEQNGRESPTGSVYCGQSLRSSTTSLNDVEIISQHPHFVKDTSKYWYRPTISREEAINMVRDKPPGTFVIRDSNSFPGAFGLALKVATPPPNVHLKGDISNELVRHFLIEPTSKGVRLKGCPNEPVFGSLSALVYQHSIMPIALPCKLLISGSDSGQSPDIIKQATINTTAADSILEQGAACFVYYFLTVDMESLTGAQAVRKAVDQLLRMKPSPVATIVHFNVSSKGITLTDNSHKLFFRRHYTIDSITHCGVDPEGRRWTQKLKENITGECYLFGFVARKAGSKTDNQCHVFSEFEREQPASAIVSFVNKVMALSPTQSKQKL